MGMPTNKYMFSLILLENHQGKTVTFVCLAETEWVLANSRNCIRVDGSLQKWSFESNIGQKMRDKSLAIDFNSTIAKTRNYLL